GGLGTEGIKEVKEEVKVYPNPAHNSITLILNEAPGNNATIGITDLTGRVISSSLVNYSSNKEFTLNISGLAAGVYFVKASSGQAVYNAKFIKE
ncbi:MAG: T9SS type A sorting domain-containing protein, partial [Bacteroidia bacterium]|nr:T9SS type A sorting domain-containing protein [Bacteroidia bacterium]